MVAAATAEARLPFTTVWAGKVLCRQKQRVDGQHKTVPLQAGRVNKRGSASLAQQAAGYCGDEFKRKPKKGRTGCQVRVG